MKASTLNLRLGCCFALLAVALGAFGAHGLKELLTERARPPADMGNRGALPNVARPGTHSGVHTESTQLHHSARL